LFGIALTDDTDSMPHFDQMSTLPIKYNLIHKA